MNTQTISLTPLIDGVQYGVSDEVAGYTYNKPTFNSDGRIGLSENNQSKKVLFSTNPKDTRFPYLVMPSKEQEVERLAKEATRNEPIQVMLHLQKYFIVGFNANPANTQAIELLKHYVGEIDELNSQQKEFGDKVEQFLLSLQPTAKAVRVEMEEYDGTTSISKDWNGKIKVETSSEYPQGVVKALEVIY